VYSNAVLDHFQHPRQAGTLAALPAREPIERDRTLLESGREPVEVVGTDGVAGQGNYLALQMRVDGERIAEAAFQTYGCPAAIACGSFVTEWITGKTVGEAATLEWDEVAVALELPLGKEHCAQLAVNALRDALNQLSLREGARR
jgi:nitrogen fixation NifU-like protein